MNMLNKRRKLMIGLTIAVLFMAFVFVGVFPYIYRSQVDVDTNLVENSFLYPLWRDLPLPIYKRLYFFNITNVDDFLKNGAAMQVDEVGPYVYIGNWKKEEVEWTDEGTVKYIEVKTFYFSSEESIGSEEDEIYTLNAPYIAASDVLQSLGSLIRKTANNILKSYKLVIKKSIKELSFGGYEDPIMSFSKYYQWNSPFSSGSFAWLYGHNATDEGDFEVFTGETDHKLLNVIDSWNGYKDLNFWEGRYCNMINGTNAEFYPPLEGKDQVEYTFFQPLVCRSITFRYKGLVDHKGITTKRFENEADIFSKDNPDNDCFQIDPELKSGVLDVSNCWYGAPVVLSFPHFYLADSSFLENINGLSPNKSSHGSHIDAEPVSGVTVDLSLKFQMNLKIKPVPELKAFANTSAGVYPVFWLEIKVELPDNLIDIIYKQLFRPKKIVYMTVGGGLCVFVMLLILATWRDKGRYYEEIVPLLKSESTKNLSPNSSNSNSSFLTDIINDHDDVKRQNSFRTCDSVSSAESLYQSFSDGEPTDVNKYVEVERLKKKSSKEKISFKDARTLTVI